MHSSNAAVEPVLISSREERNASSASGCNALKRVCVGKILEVHVHGKGGA